MNRPLEFELGVREEIDAVFAWYREQGEGLGEKFLNVLEIALESIRRNPEL